MGRSRWFLALLLPALGHALSMSASPATRKFFATTTSGMEKILARELGRLPGAGAASNIELGKCGVHFLGSERTGCAAVLHCRTALKVMECVVEGTSIFKRDDLAQLVGSVDWTTLFDVEDTIKCDTKIGQCKDHDLSHTHFSSLTVKNAVCDQFRARMNQRPSVDLEDPTMPLFLYLHKGRATLYRVWSGEASMHKRGYRDVVHRAALRETTAAGLLLAAGWPEAATLGPLCDPMCGSGTFAVEAALMAANCAPGLLRFGPGAAVDDQGRELPPPPHLVRWLDVDPHVWHECWHEAQRMDRRATLWQEVQQGSRAPLVYANDLHPGAMELAVRSAGRARVHRLIGFSNKDVRDFAPPFAPGLVVTNPPWDIRLEGAPQAWSKLGRFAQAHLGDGGRMWCLSGNPEVLDHLGFDEDTYLALSAAGVSLRFLRYTVWHDDNDGEEGAAVPSPGLKSHR